MKVKIWKIYCESDDQWERWYLPEDDPAPTTCPVNTLHNVTADSVSSVGVIGDDFARSADGSLRTVPTPATEAYEMCDRDILIKTGIYDARAQAVIAGAVSPDGDIAYAATSPGVRGNSISVEHTAGDSGAGHENRALDASVTYNTGSIEVQVIYGTDGSGNPIVPTAGAVAAMLAGKNDLLMHVFPTLLGDGSDLVQVTAATALAGGQTDSLSDVKISPTNYTKGEWSELQQVGIYKDDGQGNYVLCDDQTDATANACLSVWRYLAHNQTTGAPQIVEMRDGYMIVDAALTDSLEHQAYAIGAPQIPAHLGGSVVQFDAYLQYYKGKELGATSPQAKALDPNGQGGIAAAELRIYIYYPKTEKNTHVLRLVTYRPPGSF